MGLDDFKRRILQSLGVQVDSGFDPNHISPAPAWGTRWPTGQTYPSETPAPRPAWERYHPAPVTTEQILNVQPGHLMMPRPGVAPPPSGLISHSLPGVAQPPARLGTLPDPWAGVASAPLASSMPAAAAVSTPLLQAAAPSLAAPVLTPAASTANANVGNLTAAMGLPPLNNPTAAAPLLTAPAPLQGDDLMRPMPGVAPPPTAANPAVADEAIARASSTRSAQAAAGMKRNALDSALGMADLGVGGMAKGGLHRLGAFARANGMPGLGGALFKTGTAAAVAAPALAYGAALLPVATGAYEGYQHAGGGGAAIQGGTAAAGALTGAAIGSALLPGVGTLIGAGVGAMGGSGLGSALTKGAVGAVDAAQGGDNGLVGMIGRALDPILDSTYEKEQKEITRMENSPMMQKIRDQEALRKEEARSAQIESLLLQSYLR